MFANSLWLFHQLALSSSRNRAPKALFLRHVSFNRYILSNEQVCSRTRLEGQVTVGKKVKVSAPLRVKWRTGHASMTRSAVGSDNSTSFNTPPRLVLQRDCAESRAVSSDSWSLKRDEVCLRSITMWLVPACPLIAGKERLTARKLFSP